MTRLSACLLSLFGLGVAATALPGSASAALYGFTIAPFTEGASLTVQFEGADNNGDGVIYGYYPADCGCVTEPTEVSSLSLAFSGNALIPAFTASSTDFSDLGQSLVFETEFGDGFELFYVLNPAGAGVDFFEMPPGVVAGDGAIYLSGLVPGAYIQAVGSPCGSVLGLSGGEQGPCAVLVYDGEITSNADFAEVSEPAGLACLGAGVVGMAVARRRRGVV